MNIIQHHDYIDFDAMRDKIRYEQGHDFDDFKRLTYASGEIHSFISRTAEWKDRVYNAIGFLFDDEFTEILMQGKAVYVIILADKEADRPLSFDEVKRLEDFYSGLPENCDFVWDVVNQPGLGNAVKAVVLVAK